jgi:hypothetical protein
MTPAKVHRLDRVLGDGLRRWGAIASGKVCRLTWLQEEPLHIHHDERGSRRVDVLGSRIPAIQDLVEVQGKRFCHAHHLSILKVPRLLRLQSAIAPVLMSGRGKVSVYAVPGESSVRLPPLFSITMCSSIIDGRIIQRCRSEVQVNSDVT